MSAVLKIPVRCRYGLRALFDLAYHAPGRTAQVREIAARQQVPVRYLEQVMRLLKQDGLVKARRGRGGGYVLARELGDVTVGQVIRATHGPLVAPPREPASFPPDVWTDIQARLDGALDHLTLADLCRKGEAAGLPRGGAKQPMYFI